MYCKAIVTNAHLASLPPMVEHCDFALLHLVFLVNWSNLTIIGVKRHQEFLMLSSDPNTIFCEMTNLIWAIAFFTVRVSKSVPNHQNMYEHLSSAIVNFGRYACWRLSQGNPPSPIVKDCERLCSAGRLGQSLVLCSTMCVLQWLFYNVCSTMCTTFTVHPLYTM